MPRLLLTFWWITLACGSLVRAALPSSGNFSQTNLVAWCIVPFDTKKRSPEERAAMLEQLGIHRLAYDWRAEHIPTFDAEVAALAKRNIELTAWWFPAALNAEAKAILDCLQRHRIRTQLWITMGTEPESNPAQLDQKINGAVATLAPICTEAARLGCTVGLYNHLGWFGEPENQLRILAQLRAAGHTNAGIVYNFHHGHAQVDRFPSLLKAMQPHLLALNLNGMTRNGDKLGRKIIPLGTGELELEMIRALQQNGWRGPIGILGHTEEDAEIKLRKELTGLQRLLAQIDSPTRPAGEPAISGRDPGVQRENDWVDNRWQQTDLGPTLASILVTPSGSIAKALSIQVGTPTAGGVTYDTVTASLRAAWTGGFLQFSPSRFGLGEAPRIQGVVQQSFRDSPGWLATRIHFNGHQIHGQNVVLDLDLEGTRVLESPGLVQHSSFSFFKRSLAIAPTHRDLTWVVAAPDARPSANTWQTKDLPSGTLAKWTLGDQVHLVAIAGTPASLGLDSEGRVLLTLPAAIQGRRVHALLWKGSAEHAMAAETALSALATGPVEDPGNWVQPGARRWPTLSTHGVREADTEFLAVDTLTAPYDNPSKALLFFSGVDLTSDQVLYACTIHGDVWRVSGVNDSLANLEWKRFATGLFQPLGLKVRDNQVFVLGRDRITRLQDLNSDGEADRYESFCDRIDTSTGGHDYVTSLELDTAGNFYFVDPNGVHQVTPDGRTLRTLATGWRNPNGMGVSPDGKIITVAPQQGTWTPSSLISEVKPGGYYGYGGPKPTPNRPLGYDPHLCWIPHSVDNSSGSQVWIPANMWGPLGGQMLHLLWGRSTLMLVLRDSVDGVPQGAVVPLPAKFQSGPNRATFNPKDGHLYVAGSTGWQTNARKDGSIQRVRYTGKSASLPVGWHAEPDALILRFNQPIEKTTAEDPGSYGIKQWNYRYSQEYGSKEWSVQDPNREGRDLIEVKSAMLLPDGTSVRLGIPGLKPVMQMEVKYNLDIVGGKGMRGQLWLTLNRTGAQPR